ncbi:MAG TPA: RimK family alpha-L-glutamate ligase [Methylocella sp.]|nr:RimK family alpha-L-glutamate ligase [Methylocella sp.]
MSPSDRQQAARKALGGPKIALVVDLYDWHARDLAAAFARAGAAVVPVRLAQCGFDTRRPSGLVIPGFGADLPDAVFVRAIGSGTFESVILRLDVLHSLGAIGVPVFNSARAVEICVDKAAASFVLARHAIPTPPTWTVQSEQAARQIVRREAGRGPLVLKPLFGAQGFGLKLVRREADLPPFEAVEGVYYLQRFIAAECNGFRDFRVLVSQGQVVAAMTRHASHWITNVKLGARPEWCEPDAAMIDLALRAAAAAGADFAGVDMIRDAADALHVLEINSMPGWRGLQKVAPFSIADRLAADLLSRIGWPRAKAAL